MSQKGTEKKKDESLEVDFSSFEREIDAEIDKLFVPMGLPPTEAEKAPTAPETGLQVLGEVEESVTVALDSSDVTILKEASPSATELPEPVAGSLPEVSAQDLFDSVELKSPPQPAAAGLEGAAVAEALSVPLSVPGKVSEVPLERQPPSPSRGEEIQPLLDRLNAAFLSLGKDSCSTAIQGVETAVLNLKPYWQDSNEGSSIVKILRPVLQHTKTRQDPPSPLAIDFITDALDLLRKVIQPGATPGPGERVEIRNLVTRMQSLKRTVLTTVSAEPQGPAPIVAALDESIETVLPSTPVAAPQAFPEELVAVASPHLRELLTWMSSFLQTSDKAVRGLEVETRRLTQLEQMVATKPGLAPLGARLAKTRSAIEEVMEEVRKKEGEWADQLKLYQSAEALMTDRSFSGIPASPLQSIRSDISELPEKPVLLSATAAAHGESTQPVPEVPTPVVESRQETVCMFQTSGRRYAVPASYVVKVQKLQLKTASKLMNRGFATLDDFKPFFKSLKTGILGTFNDLPAKVLKDYRFLPMFDNLWESKPDGAPRAEVSSPFVLSPAVGGIVLLSDTQHHGMVFIDGSETIVREETVRMDSREEGFLGVIGSESSSIPVLNVKEALLKLQD